MIETADEFRRLRQSDNPAENHRAAYESASLDVWLEVIRRWPDMRFWVAHNKTVPLPVLEVLANDSEDRVRWMVTNKRSWKRAHRAG